MSSTHFFQNGTSSFTKIGNNRYFRGFGRPKDGFRGARITAVTGQREFDARLETALRIFVHLGSGICAEFVVANLENIAEALETIERNIAPRLKHEDIRNIPQLDQIVNEEAESLDPQVKAAISMACTRAAAEAFEIPVYEFVSGGKYRLPVPLLNLSSLKQPGLIGEFMLIPAGYQTFREATFRCLEAFQQVRATHQVTTIDGKGGLPLDLSANEETLASMMGTLLQNGERLIPGRFMFFGINRARYSREKSLYHIPESELESHELISMYQRWIDSYPLIHLENGMSPEDRNGCLELARRLGSRALIAGDEQVGSCKRDLLSGFAKAIVIRPEQIGTMTDTVTAIEEAKSRELPFIISSVRAGTGDTFLADFAVGVDAPFVHLGPSRAENTAITNRLLKIERGLGPKSYLGLSAFSKDIQYSWKERIGTWDQWSPTQ